MKNCRYARRGDCPLFRRRRKRGLSPLARRGFTLIEMAAASAVLGVVLVITYQAVVGSAAQDRAAARRETALREAAGAMERLAAAPWDAVAPEAGAAAGLSPEARHVLPDGRLLIDVVPCPDEPQARKLTVEVRWPGGPGQPEACVRLVAWRYATATAPRPEPKEKP